MNVPPTTLESIIQETLRRRAGGEQLEDDVVIAANPELMPQIEVELKKLRLIAGARAEAGAAPAEFGDTVIHSQEMSQEDTDSQLAEDRRPRVEVPDYELLKFLGRGGFGEVYLGRHRIHGEFSAVKIFAKRRATELDGVRAYKQRAQQNSNLVPIEHVGELAEAYYYVMPLADDVKPRSAVRAPESYEPKSLKWCIDNLPPFTPEKVAEIGAELLEGLEALHEVGLTHSDVKPANIMAFDGRWRLGDLGLMGPTEHISGDRGTSSFWPPEGPSDPTADLYALALTLYLLLSSGELLRFQDFVAGRDLPEGDPEQLSLLRGVIARACHEEPGQRYLSARAMRADLEVIPGRTKSHGPKTLSTRRWLLGGLVAVVLLGALALLFNGNSDTDVAIDSLSSEGDTAGPERDAQVTIGQQPTHRPTDQPVRERSSDTKPGRLAGQETPGNASADSAHSDSPSADPFADRPGNLFVPLVRIQPGEFWMGSLRGETGRNENEGPEHRVRLSRSFFIGQYEVTQRQYDQLMEEKPSARRNPDSPVENVSWHDAIDFCHRLSERDGRRYRLPTEAEWEYVCRAGSTTAYAAGAELTAGSTALPGGLPGAGPAKVGTYEANAWDVYDMHGNVWEWCQDGWDTEYYDDSPDLDPGGPDNGSLRMIRGGSWRDGATAARSASRRKLHSNSRRDDVGFRVVCEE